MRDGHNPALILLCVIYSERLINKAEMNNKVQNSWRTELEKNALILAPIVFFGANTLGYYLNILVNPWVSGSEDDKQNLGAMISRAIWLLVLILTFYGARNAFSFLRSRNSLNVIATGALVGVGLWGMCLIVETISAALYVKGIIPAVMAPEHMPDEMPYRWITPAASTIVVAAAYLKLFVLGPAIEEWVFRRLALIYTVSRLGVWVGSLVISLLFMLVHSKGGWLTAFFFSLTLSVLYVHRRSLLEVCVAHGIYNVLAYTNLHTPRLGFFITDAETFISRSWGAPAFVIRDWLPELVIGVILLLPFVWMLVAARKREII